MSWDFAERGSEISGLDWVMWLRVSAIGICGHSESCEDGVCRKGIGNLWIKKLKKKKLKTSLFKDKCPLAAVEALAALVPIFGPTLGLQLGVSKCNP